MVTVVHLFEHSHSQGPDNKRMAVSFCGVSEQETGSGRHSMALVRSGTNCEECVKQYLAEIRATVNYVR